MRLTEKNEFGNYIGTNLLDDECLCRGLTFDELNEMTDIFNKLGQLEDIESILAERLDIEDFDLTLVLTFILKGGYFKDHDGNIKKAKFITFNFEDGTFSCHYRNGCHFKDYEDIGKEIALTKEELL